MTVTTIEAELLHVEEAARYLAISRSRAYEMAASGEMPGLIRMGRSLRVSRRRLLQWIDEQANGGATPASAAPQEVGRDSDRTPTISPYHRR